MIFNNKLDQVFDKIPIFGMVHLAGENPVKRALDELAIFDEEFVDAAIIENYHGSVLDVVETLDAISKQKETQLSVCILELIFYQMNLLML